MGEQYLQAMTKLLEKAAELVRQLPPRSQDEIAAAMLNLAAGDAKAEEIDPAHLPAVLEGLEQARRGEFAADEDVEALFRQFGK